MKIKPIYFFLFLIVLAFIFECDAAQKGKKKKLKKKKQHHVAHARKQAVRKKPVKIGAQKNHQRRRTSNRPMSTGRPKPPIVPMLASLPPGMFAAPMPPSVREEDFETTTMNDELYN